MHQESRVLPPDKEYEGKAQHQINTSSPSIKNKRENLQHLVNVILSSYCQNCHHKQYLMWTKLQSKTLRKVVRIVANKLLIGIGK